MKADKPRPLDSSARRTYNLLVFAVEKVGLTAPKDPIRRANYTLTFEPYTTARRFSDFDGVIMFQGIFEQVKYASRSSDTRVSVERDKEQLDRRQKEIELLLEKGGITCFLLWKPFVDHAEYGQASSSDLAKIALNYSHFYRKNFDNRQPSIDAKRNEFIRFLGLYGAASSYFEDLNKGLDLRPIATRDSALVGFSLLDQQYFVPSLKPENRPENIQEYFDLLADALTTTANKLALEVPDWIDAFRFSEERALLERKAKLQQEIDAAEKRIAALQNFKRVLVGGDDPLVGAVANLLRAGLGYSVGDVDELREDLKILDEKGNPVVFVEVKGVNAGVKLEHVNQADTHRERAGLPSSFPSVLVLNTHVKNARDLKEKDKPIGEEQVARAVKMRVLIVRTLDLLALMELVNKGVMTPAQVLDLFKRDAGWLQVWGFDSPVMVEG